MKAPSSQCALCLKPKTEKDLRRSHVVSESLYKDLYEKHRYSVITLDKDTKARCEQKGIRERLLCAECEQLLGNKYEDYGAREYIKIKSACVRQRGPFAYHVDDYPRFKMFQIAQIWRMSIAKDPLWQRVVLPQSTQEDLRQMLLHGKPGAPDYYGVMMEFVVADDGTAFDAFVPPITVRLEEYHFVLATFAGFSWYYSAHRQVKNQQLAKHFMTMAGEIIINVRQLRDAWHIQRFGDAMEQLGKL